MRRVVIERHTDFDPATLPTDPHIQEILGAISADPERTRRIADDVLAELAAGRFALVLTERRAHLDALAALLRDAAPELVTLHGGMGVRARRRAEQLLAGDEPRIVLATGRYIGEGFDDPRLDTLVLAMPIAWSGTMTQYAGRLDRQHADKRRSASSTTSITKSRSCDGCTPSANARTRSSATGHLTRRRPAWQCTEISPSERTAALLLSHHTRPCRPSHGFAAISLSWARLVRLAQREVRGGAAATRSLGPTWSAAMLCYAAISLPGHDGLDAR